jgi:fluoride exporter
VSALVAALLVALGGAVGAPLRYVTDLVVSSLHDTVFPWGTWVVNVTGSLVLGVVGGLVADGAPPWSATLVGTGICGALTTFSSFGYETVRLAEEGAVGEAALNVVGSLAAGLLFCTAGFALGTALG